MEPDVIVTYANQTTLFRAQNKQASDTARGCVKSADLKFGNDHIFDMANFDEPGRQM
jgi:hypothetical protein